MSPAMPQVIGTAVSVDDLTVAAGGSITVNSGGSLSVAGSLFNHGTLAQTQPVDGSGPVNFFNTGSYGGLTLNPEMQNLGVTTVTIRGNQNCTAVAGETVERCFDISPGVPSPVGSTTLTFYFDSSELSGNSCAALDAFHWNGASWNVLPRDTNYNGDGRLCGSDPQSIQSYRCNRFLALRSESKSAKCHRDRKLLRQFCANNLIARAGISPAFGTAPWINHQKTY